MGVLVEGGAGWSATPVMYAPMRPVSSLDHSGAGVIRAISYALVRHYLNKTLAPWRKITPIVASRLVVSSRVSADLF